MTVAGKIVSDNTRRIMLNKGVTVRDVLRPVLYDRKLRDILNGEREPTENDIWLITKALECTEEELMRPCEPLDWSKVSANIRTRLNAMDKTQMWLSEETGIPNSTLSLICTGTSRRPRPFNLMCIAQALGCRTEDLFR